MRISLRYILLCLFTILYVNVWGQSKHALIIGIGNYPEGSGWNKIHGNNDIQIIDKALKRQGFTDGNIIQLVDSKATKNNILGAFDRITSICSNGDIVYIHFSGHGQQVTDLNGDEDDGFDESWIPYDAQKKYQAGVYEGQNHLIDDELNSLLSKIRERVGVQGKIIVIADACHSGSGSRSLQDDDVFVRGTSDSFIIPQTGSPVVVKKTQSTDWLFVGACKSYQSNYEYRTKDGVYYGVLSYIIATDSKQFNSSKYTDIIKDWDENVSLYSRYPQNLDNEGQPSRRNQLMF